MPTSIHQTSCPDFSQFYDPHITRLTESHCDLHSEFHRLLQSTSLFSHFLVFAVHKLTENNSYPNRPQNSSGRWWSSAGRFYGLFAKVRVSYELPTSVLKQYRTPADFSARFAGISSAPIKAPLAALRMILIEWCYTSDKSIHGEIFPFLKLLTARSISAKVLAEMLSGTVSSRGSKIMQPFPYSFTL